jgi:uncharacterized protein
MLLGETATRNAFRETLTGAAQVAGVSAYTHSVHPALQSVDHRPWPLPAGPWIMRQTWHDLLFAHWPVPAAGLRALVPEPLELDLFNGEGWIGVVPFHMTGIRGRGLLPVPGLSQFPELNVRTYVTYRGKPGVYFFSLDAASRCAVWAARAFYHLPYFHAAMASEESCDGVHYASRRRGAEAEFRGRYRPISPVQRRERGSIEHWLTERYCLYTTYRNPAQSTQGRVYRCEIHHLPWPLQNAEAELEINTVAKAGGVCLPNTAPLLHFSRRLEVLIWPLRGVD